MHVRHARVCITILRGNTYTKFCLQYELRIYYADNKQRDLSCGENLQNIPNIKTPSRILWKLHCLLMLRTGQSICSSTHCHSHYLPISSIGDNPTLSRITSFRTLSLLVCPQNHRNIRISATLSCWTCRLLKVQLNNQYKIKTIEGK